MTRYFIDTDGNYLGGFDGALEPAGAVEVGAPPQDARQKWAGGAWGALPASIPDRVSSRQFKLQLLAAGLLDEVDAWVSSQSRAVQIAYADSSSFVRGEPMMQSGFAAMGFTSDQIDAFFAAAAAL